MSTTTPNYGFIKPALGDAANIEAPNPNWDKIDTKLNELETNLESIDLKTEKHILSYESGKIKESETGAVLNFAQVYTMLLNSPDFVVLVYQDKAYHPNVVSTTSVVFSSTTVSNGNIKVDRITMASNGSITTTSGEAEKTSSKTDDVAGNATDSSKYPSTKGVADYVDGNYLPLTGGTLSGALSVNGGLGQLRADATGVSLDVTTNGEQTTSDRTLWMMNATSSSDIKDALKFVDTTDGFTAYNLFGEHNKDSLPELSLTGQLTILNDFVTFTGTKDNGAFIAVHDDKTQNYRSFGIYPPSVRDNNNNALTLYSVTNGNVSAFDIFGSNNKPSGTYTGTGSSTTRDISTGGIGSVCVIRGANYGAILTPTGGLYWAGWQTSSTIYVIPYTSAWFSDGTIRLMTSSAWLNTNGTIYSYQVL